MKDPTTVLYALSTIAQTCAALAAFVGAVGLYGLGQLAERRNNVERELRALNDRIGGSGQPWVPMREVIAHVRREQQRANEPENRQNTGYQANVRAAEEALERWEGFVPHICSSRWWLVVFEAWNLIVIGVSLIGFNHVTTLAASPLLSVVLLWAIALGTVFVTLRSVMVWTKG